MGAAASRGAEVAQAIGELSDAELQSIIRQLPPSARTKLTTSVLAVQDINPSAAAEGQQSEPPQCLVMTGHFSVW